MIWNVDKLYNYQKFLTKKNQSGNISATDFFYAWNSEQNSYHSDVVGRWQMNSNGKSGLNTGLIMNETIQQILSPFTLTANITLASGEAEKPSDFIFELALRKGIYRIQKINHDQIYSVEDSVIDTPSATTNTLYCVEYENYYSLLPASTTGDITLDYVAQPEDVVWGYTLDAQGRQVYNPGTSVQPKWSTPTVIEITKRTLKSLGIGFKDQDFINAGQSAIATGN